jgi:hypothetical protein
MSKINYVKNESYKYLQLVMHCEEQKQKRKIWGWPPVTVIDTKVWGVFGCLWQEEIDSGSAQQMARNNKGEITPVFGDWQGLP